MTKRGTKDEAPKGSVRRRIFGAVLHRLLHDRSTYRGLTIEVHYTAEPKIRERLHAALDLIAQVDPITFANLRRYLTGGIIIAREGTSSGWFDTKRKACFLNACDPAFATPGEITATIVHEVCHARLDHCGIGYDEKDRQRVERVCVRRELAFGRKLEPLRLEGYDPVTRAQKKLEWMAEVDLSDDAHWRRTRALYLQKLRKLKELGAPYWLRRWAVRGLRRKFREHAAKRRRDDAARDHFGT